MAVKRLESENYKILARNWRYSRAEIDIIAKQEDILVFIEVKTRTSEYYGKPEDAVSSYKEGLILDAAQRYMEQIGHDWEIRFDIISIIVTASGDLKKLDHYQDAFF